MKFSRLISAILIALFATILTTPFFTTSAFAHRDGCHAHHSCPSDTGSYVCGDLGIYTYCNTTPSTNVVAPATTSGNGSFTILPVDNKPGTISRSSNIRSGPGTTFAVVGSGRASQAITIIGQNENGSWYQIGDGQWIAASLVNTTENAVVPVVQPVITSSAKPPSESADNRSGTINRDANLRSGPGTNFPIAGTGKSGQAITILGQNTDGSWYQIRDGQWIAAFLVNVDNAAGGTPAAPQPAAPAPAAQPAQAQLPPYWKEANKAICGNFEWQVVDVRRPEGLWFYGQGAARQNESFLVIYIEIKNIGSTSDQLLSIRPAIGGSNLPDWDASYNAAWMMTGGQNNPWEYFNPGQVITVAAAYDVPRNDAWGFSMMRCAGNAVNIGEWNALSKDAIRANTN